MSIDGQTKASIKTLTTDTTESTEATFKQGLDYVINEVDSLNTAPPVATTGYDVFTSSGTWDFEAAGSPDTVFVTLVGGGGGGSVGYYEGSCYRGVGGTGGVILWREVSVNSNETVTVGGGGSGSGGNNKNTIGASAGGDTDFGPISVGGGAASSYGDGGSGGTATGPGSLSGYTGYCSTTTGNKYSSPFGGVGAAGIGYGGSGRSGIVIVAY
ncbi:MAG: hypothetical protein NZ824_11580 [Candidatus Thioglobus sp.]|nr:hypothetical protein [Candidatus Thioglobus sp.]